MPRSLAQILKSYRFKMAMRIFSPHYLKLTLRRRWTGERLIVVIGSAHKVGSTWLVQMLTDLLVPEYEFENHRIPKAYRSMGQTLDASEEGAVEMLRRLRGYRLFKTHQDLPEPGTLPDAVRVITVHRDLRDACISAIFFLASLPAEAGGYPEPIRSAPDKERLLFQFQRIYALDRHEYWWRYPAAAKLRYEDLKRDAVGELQRIMEALGADVEPGRIEEVVAWHDFKRRSGRKEGVQDAQSFLRKGIVGDWVNYFDDETMTAFKTAQQGRWNQMLVEMGYEEDLAWTRPVEAA